MSECFMSKDGVCVSRELVDEIYSLLGLRGNARSTADKMQEIMHHLTASSEKEIWMKPEVLSLLGSDHCNLILKSAYKPSGPTGTQLLSNEDIDNILMQWELNCQAFAPGKKFKMFPFAMADLWDIPSTHPLDNPIKKVDWKDLSQKFTSAAVVFNTDVSSGRGKHWICVFIDFQALTFEFFNTSSNPPIEAVVKLYERVKSALPEMKMIKVVNHPIQESNTECGAWCLLYIWSRLMNYPFTEISGAKDKDATSFRSVVYKGSGEGDASYLELIIPMQEALERYLPSEYHKAIKAYTSYISGCMLIVSSGDTGIADKALESVKDTEPFTRLFSSPERTTKGTPERTTKGTKRGGIEEDVLQFCKKYKCEMLDILQQEAEAIRNAKKRDLGAYYKKLLELYRGTPKMINVKVANSIVNDCGCSSDSIEDYVESLLANQEAIESVVTCRVLAHELSKRYSIGTPEYSGCESIKRNLDSLFAIGNVSAKKLGNAEKFLDRYLLN